MSKGEVYITGVGPGSSEWVSDRVRSLVTNSNIIVGWQQDFRPVIDLIKNQKVFLQEGHNYLEVPKQAALEAERTGETVLVLKTGDPLVAPAGLKGIMKIFEGFKITVIPGISSVQLAAAKAGVTLFDSAIITYHPLPHDGGSDLRKKRRRMLQALDLGLHLIVLTGVRQMPSQTAQFLLNQPISPHTPVIVCENLTYPEECITKCSLEMVALKRFDWLSVMVVRNCRNSL